MNENFKLKQIRLTMGLSQNKMAALIGITQGTLSKIEDNIRPIDKYSKKIQDVWNKWRDDKIKHLENEINYLKQLNNETEKI